MVLTVGDVQVKAQLDRPSLNSSLNAAKGDVESWASGIESRTSKLGSAISSSLKVGLAAAAGVGAIETKALMTYKDLESAASNAASKSVDVSGKSIEQIKKQYDDLQKHVISVSRELGASTVFDPTDVAKTYDVLAGKGYEVAKVGKNELLPFLDLAAATQSNLADTTDLVTGTMASFGMSISDSQKVADMYTKAINATSADQTKFNYALRQGASAAAASGMPLQTYMAIVGDLAGKNYTGEQSGEALKTSIMKLYNPTKAQTDALAKLGISYDQVDPRTHSFIDTLALLKSKGADIGAFGEIFTESSGAILNALSMDIDKVKALSGSISDSGGLSHTIAGLVMGSDKLVGAFENAKGATTDLWMALGQYLEPGAVKMLNTWSALVPKIEEFGDAISKGDWSKAGKALSDGLGIGFDFLEDKAKGIYDKFKGIKWKELGDYIQKAVEGGWKELYSLGTQLLAKLKGVRWGELGQTVGSTIANALIGLGQWVYNAFSNVKWDQAAQTIIGGLKGALDYYLNYYTTLGTTLYNAISKIEWGTIGQQILDSLKSIGGEISKVFDGISFDDLGQKLADGIKSGLNLLQQIGQTVWNTLNNLHWEEIGQTIGKAINTAIDTLKDIGSKIGGFLSGYKWGEIGSDLATKIKNGITTVLGWADSIVKGIKETVKWDTYGQDIGNAIKSGIASTKNFHETIYNDIKAWADSTGPNELGKKVGSALSSGLKAALDLAKWIYDNLTGTGEGKTQEKWQDLGLKIGTEFVTGFIEGFTKPLDNAIGVAINNAFANAFDNLASYIPDLPGLSDLKANLRQSAQLSRTAIQTVYASPTQTSTPVTTPKAAGVQTTANPYANLQDWTPYEVGGVSGYIFGGRFVPGTPGGSTSPTSTPSISSSAGSVSGIVAGLSNWGPEDLASAVAKSGKFASANEAVNAIRSYYQSIGASPDTISELFNGKLQKVVEDNFVAPVKEAGETQKREVKSMMDSVVRPPIKSMMDGVTSAGQNVYTSISSAAQNSLRIGSEVSSSFKSAGNAVSIYLNSAGQQVAVIGEVAKQKWSDAGYKLLSGSEATATKTAAVGTQAATTASNTQVNAATSSAGKTVSAGSGFKSSVDQGASVALSAIAKAGDPGQKLVIGAQYAASALISAGQTIAGLVRSSASAWNYVSPSLRSFFGYAAGTRTSGPQMAMIGEDGSAYPEFVIPTKTKRWDLLYQALRAYGIGGFAEGGSTGSTSSADGSNVVVTFGIPGIVNAAKDIKRTLTDLQNYFRITWNIIKSDALQYWMAISAWLTGKLSELSTSVSASAISWRASLKSNMVAISSEQLQSWSQVALQAKTNLQSISDYIVSENQQMKQSLTSGLNEISNGLTAFSSNWQNTWGSTNTYFQGQAQEIQARIQEIINELTSLGSMQVSPSVNVNYTGGGGGGGDYGGWSPEGGGSGDWLNEGGVCQNSGSPTMTSSAGVVQGSSNVQQYINYTPTFVGSTGLSSISSFFSGWGARGADITSPQMIGIAEKGPELVLPTDIRNTIVDLTRMGYSQMQGAGGVQEIHIHQHLNDREIAHEVFKVGAKMMRAKGLSLA